MLRAFMQAEYAKCPTPTILMGDMNQSLTSDILASLTEPARLITDLYLKDSWSLSDTSSNRVPTHYHFAKGNVLDYLLVSQEFDPNWSCSMLQIVDYTVLDEHLINPHSQQDRYASDHAFVALKVHILV
jgi:endonuclease/exonuclease/phosphatase family metal-dependent hydrolase